jgi:hypothetical protein
VAGGTHAWHGHEAASLDLDTSQTRGLFSLFLWMATYVHVHVDLITSSRFVVTIDCHSHGRWGHDYMAWHGICRLLTELLSFYYYSLFSVWPHVLQLVEIQCEESIAVLGGIKHDAN